MCILLVIARQIEHLRRDKAKGHRTWVHGHAPQQEQEHQKRADVEELVNEVPIMSTVLLERYFGGKRG